MKTTYTVTVNDGGAPYTGQTMAEAKKLVALVGFYGSVATVKKEAKPVVAQVVQGAQVARGSQNIIGGMFTGMTFRLIENRQNNWAYGEIYNNEGFLVTALVANVNLV